MATDSKNIEKLTFEQLMELAKLPVKEPNKKLSQVKRFIISDGLKEGSDAIPASLIYSRYKEWCTINIQEPLSLVKFFKEFKLYYKKIIKDQLSHYLLSAHGFDFSLEKIFESKKDITEKRTSQRGNNTKKKKQPVQTES